MPVEKCGFSMLKKYFSKKSIEKGIEKNKLVLSVFDNNKKTIKKSALDYFEVEIDKCQNSR